MKVKITIEENDNPRNIVSTILSVPIDFSNFVKRMNTMTKKLFKKLAPDGKWSKK